LAGLRSSHVRPASRRIYAAAKKPTKYPPRGPRKIGPNQLAWAKSEAPAGLPSDRPIAQDARREPSSAATIKTANVCPYPAQAPTATWAHKRLAIEPPLPQPHRTGGKPLFQGRTRSATVIRHHGGQSATELRFPLNHVARRHDAGRQQHSSQIISLPRSRQTSMQIMRPGGRYFGGRAEPRVGRAPSLAPLSRTACTALQPSRAVTMDERGTLRRPQGSPPYSDHTPFGLKSPRGPH